jgi:HEAT repeat protein
MDAAKQKIFLISWVGVILLLFAGCSSTVPKGSSLLREEMEISLLDPPSALSPIPPPVPFAEPVLEPFPAAETTSRHDPFLEAVSKNDGQRSIQSNQPEIVPNHSLPDESAELDFETAKMTEVDKRIEIETALKSESESELESESESESESEFETKSELELEPETEPISDAEQERILSKDKWAKNIMLERWMENGMNDPFPSRNSAEQKRRAEINWLNMSEKESRKANHFNYEYLASLPSTWRWFHGEMEKLSNIPSELRGSPEFFLRDENYRNKNNAVLRANAVILMGRDGDPFAEKDLIAVIRNNDFRTELRCAAAETLGKLRTVSADTLLSILEPFQEKEVETKNPQTGLTVKKFEAGNSALWLEILLALSERLDPWEHPCFLQPFSARTFEIRWEVAKLWRRRSPPKKRNGTPAGGTEYQLPDAFLEYVRQETNSMIRVELIRTLGLWKTPNIFAIIGSDLNREVIVRNAAAEALAEADCQEAISSIKQRLTDSVPQNRAKMVEALRKLGSLEDVFRMVNDSDPSVRIEVAKAFADRCSPQTVTMAKRYINDHHEKVRQATLDAVTNWSIGESGLILLEAAKNQDSHGIRIKAAAHLAHYGIENKNFDPADFPKNQTQQHEELIRCFHATIHSADFDSKNNGNNAEAMFAVDPKDPEVADVRRSLRDWRQPNLSRDERLAVRNRLTDLEHRLIPILDYLYEIERRKIPESLDPVIAEVDSAFEMIVQLNSGDINERRQAASKLAQLAAIRHLSQLALRRILEQVNVQTDPSVLTPLLETLKTTDSDAAKQFSVTLSQSESPELRRLACGTFKEFPDSNDLPLLVDLLRDSDKQVFQSVLGVLTAIFRNEKYEDNEDAERLKIIEILSIKLQQKDIRQQVEIATVLYHLGEPAGEETFRRLILSPDSRVKCYAIEKIAELGDRRLIPVLITMLDDRNSNVRIAALNGLPKSAGEDIGILDFGKSYSAGVSITQQKIARWKKWAEHLAVGQPVNNSPAH